MTLPTVDRTSEMVSAESIPAPPAKAPVAESLKYKATETYSRQVLGATSFELHHLFVGEFDPTEPPWQVAPYDQPSIIGSHEMMHCFLCIKFDTSALTRLLMCLGTDVYATFHFEGFGGKAAEKDLKVKVTTVENQFKYALYTRITPKELGLTPGFYKVAATVQIGPITHRCGQYILGYGYIGEKNIQIATYVP